MMADSRPQYGIIFSSGYGAVDDIDFHAYTLPKPYDLVQLQNLLAEVGLAAPD